MSKLEEIARKHMDLCLVNEDAPLNECILAALREVVEECAKVCDENAKRNFPWGSENSDRYHAQADWAEHCAAAIRKLLEDNPELTRCTRKKCGEYNMLRCSRQANHSGECAFVVDDKP